MSSRESVEFWREQIEDGLEYRRRFGLEDKWGTLEAIYYGVHESMLNDGPNIFLSQGDAILSTLNVPSPMVRVKPTNAEATAKAPLVESVDNTLLEELRVSEEVETATLHAYLFSRGIIKLGYDSEWGYDPTLDLGGQLRMGLTLSQLNRKGDRLLESDSTVVPGMPWAKAVMPHDFVVPWGTKEIESAPWVAHRLVRHIDDLRADRKYENTRDLRAGIAMRDFVESYRNTIKPMMRNMASGRKAEYVEFYEIHERVSGRIFAITWDYSKFLRNETNALQIDNQLPFVSIAFTPRTRSFWTTPDAFYLLPTQLELSDVAIQRTKQRRLAVLKFLYDGNTISDEELQKLLSTDVGAAAKIEGGQEITKAIMRLDNAPNQSLVAEEELLRANAREQLGFSRNQMGEFTGGRKTAREVSVVDRSSQLRMSRRGLQTKRLYEDIIKVINGIIFSQWTLPRVVRVAGKAAGEEWVRLTGPELKSRYSYKVEFIDQNEMDSEKLGALQLYSMLAQDPGIDPIELRGWLIDRFNDPSFTRIFNADVRLEVLQRRMLAAAGDLQSKSNRGNGNGQAPAMQNLRGANGQMPFEDSARLLARGGNNPGAR